MAENPTLKQISEHLNVSISTVSRALKDHPDVSAETKRRVRELAEFLDYEPNGFAVNLRTRHRNIFAVLVPEIGNYFYHGFVQAVEEESRAMGYSVMIFQSMGDAETERQNLRICRQNKVAGIFIAVCAPLENEDYFIKLEGADIPILFFDLVPPGNDYNKVCLEDEEIGKLAAEKILEANPAQVLCLMGKEELNITRGRLSGLKSGLLSGGSAYHVEHCANQDAAFASCLRHLKQYPETGAIFCMSDEVMCGALQCLHQLGKVPGREIKLLAVSNGFLPSLFSPSISYIKTNGYELGKMSFERMKEIRAGKSSAFELHLPCSFVAGESL